MTDSYIDYPQLIDSAMRSVVREVLRDASKNGLPGEHHFFVSFKTEFPGVSISEQLKSRYPQEMTIVLQHQFWDFKVEDHRFQVTLSFGGVPEKIVIPYAALTAFADPSVKFGLQFTHMEVSELELMDTETGQLPLTAPVDKPTADAASAEVISLDAFRKK
ncbi:MAG: SspB family protein [Alphaproteobacteria bacterium]